MAAYFNDLFVRVIKTIGKQNGSVEPHIFFNSEENSVFYGVNNVYPDGLEILFLRGNVDTDIVLENDLKVGDDHLIVSFMVNVQHMINYYPDDIDTEVKQHDVMAFHNYHSGFKAVFSANTDFMLISIRITGTMLEQAKGIIEKNTPNLFDTDGAMLYIRHHLTPELSKCLGDVDKFLQMPNDFFIPYIRAKAHELFIVSLYEITRSTSNLLKYSISQEKLALANKVRVLIQKDLSEHLSIPEIAQEVGSSETTIKEVFSRVNGVTIYNFYQNRRLAKALQLLQMKEMPILEIAFQLGFSSSSNFSKFFKKMTGMTPREYIQKKVGSN